MSLTEVEKCAGRWFRKKAEFVLEVALTDFPDCTPCSAQVSFFRHECPAVKGRTRAVQLKDMTLTSPEIWVAWSEDYKLEVVTPAEVQDKVEEGIVVEVEQVLAGKFSFTWKQGKCSHCQLPVMSREGVLKDNRVTVKIEQGDLAIPGAWPGGMPALRRESGL